MANANRNSSPTDRWATPFTRLKWETSFGIMLKQAFGEKEADSNGCLPFRQHIVRQKQSVRIYSG
ncbi:hypothetical protein ETC05_06470 [Geobacillus sp. BMUD]|nr:hypothetical protein [Geobacillus sp. BMUD]